jgi:hypothetical protein
MKTISLTTALKLIRFNPQLDSEAAEILQSAMDELERLYKVEAAMIELEATKQQEQGEADWLEAQVIARPG